MTVSPLAVLALLGNTVIWGLSWIAFKSLQGHGLHPVWATAFVFLGCTTLLLILRPRVIREVFGRKALLLVAFAAGATNMSFNTAVAFGDVVRVVLLFYLMPVWAILLARLVLKEPLTVQAVARIVVGLSGAGIVLYHPGMGLPLPSSWTDWLAIFGGMMFALNNVTLRGLQGVSDGARAIAMLAGGSILGIIIGTSLSTMGLIAPVSQASSAILPILGLWIVLMLAANLFLQYGVARLPASMTAVVMLNEVFVASVSAWALGAAHIRVQDFIGGALIMMAPWLFRKIRR